MFTLTVDVQAFSAIERALSFYRDRAILPDGDPAVELSRKFTTLLLKLRNAPAPKLLPEAQDAPETGVVPEQVPDVQEESKVSTEGSVAPQEENPLDQTLENMLEEK